MKPVMQFLDTRGEICPMPLVLTNSRLKQMTSGDLLKVISSCASLLPDIRSLFRKRCTVMDYGINNNVVTVTLRKN